MCSGIKIFTWSMITNFSWCAHITGIGVWSGCLKEEHKLFISTIWMWVICTSRPQSPPTQPSFWNNQTNDAGCYWRFWPDDLGRSVSLFITWWRWNHNVSPVFVFYWAESYERPLSTITVLDYHGCIYKAKLELEILEDRQLRASPWSGFYTPQKGGDEAPQWWSNM